MGLVCGLTLPFSYLMLPSGGLMMVSRNIYPFLNHRGQHQSMGFSQNTRHVTFCTGTVFLSMESLFFLSWLCLCVITTAVRGRRPVSVNLMWTDVVSGHLSVNVVVISCQWFQLMEIEIIYFVALTLRERLLSWHHRARSSTLPLHTLPSLLLLIPVSDRAPCGGPVLSVIVDEYLFSECGAFPSKIKYPVVDGVAKTKAPEF